MNGVDIASITRINRNDNRPRMVCGCEWLKDMGFTSGALVQFIPEPGGMTFALCNENIRDYSELDRHTKANGGTLMQVYLHPYGLQLCISGARLDATGLVWHDKLLIRYEPGLVRMRKLPKEAVKLTTPHVIGKWLAESGFVPDAVLAVGTQPGLITCTLQENGIERTAELVKYARANKLTLLQIHKRKCKHSVYQWFDIPSSCLEKAGFAPDELLLATYEYGIIKLRKPDFAELGF